MKLTDLVSFRAPAKHLDAADLKAGMKAVIKNAPAEIIDVRPGTLGGVWIEYVKIGFLSNGHLHRAHLNADDQVPVIEK